MTTQPKVIVTRVIPAAGLERLRAACQIQVWEEELPPPYDWLLANVKGADGLLTLLTDRIDAGLMDAAGPQLKVISQMAVGYDNIDVPAATARGIAVGHTPGVLTEATADFTWALLTAAARRVVEGDRFARTGRWRTWGPTLLLGQDLYRATLGIVGLGRIGQAVARRAAGFSMRVLYHARHPNPDLEASLGLTYVDLETLLRESDFVSLHTPLTEATHHLISRPQLALMKPTAILINTARGPVVDPEALFQALAGGQIAGAALDVTEPEPLPADHPLYGLDNIIICPHIASASVTTRNRMALMAAENLIAGLQGQPLPHCVNC